MAARGLPENAIHPCDKRVAEIARLAAMNIRANQWMKKPHDGTSR